MKIKGDHIILSSGKNLYAYNGIIGLSPDSGVFSGYDDAIHTSYDPQLTKDELIELADHMIGQWLAFKEKIGDS